MSVKSRESSSLGAVQRPGVSYTVLDPGPSSPSRPPSCRNGTRPLTLFPADNDNSDLAGQGAGGIAAAESDELRQQPPALPSASFGGFVPPPRLAHIQMLMRRLEGTMAAGGQEEQQEGEGTARQHSPASGRVPPPASADSGNSGSNFDVSHSLFP